MIFCVYVGHVNSTISDKQKQVLFLWSRNLVTIAGKKCGMIYCILLKNKICLLYTSRCVSETESRETKDISEKKRIYANNFSWRNYFFITKNYTRPWIWYLAFRIKNITLCLLQQHTEGRQQCDSMASWMGSKWYKNTMSNPQFNEMTAF